MKHLALTLMTVLTLTACSGTSERYTVPAPATEARQSIAFRSVEVREVSLPAYAAADEIPVQDDTGKLVSDGAVLWADTPDRAIALEISRHLAGLSGARVASAPWPFESFPDARLDVRFETLVAGNDATFRAAGQYFVAVADGGRERSGLFNLAVPYDPAAGPAAIAAARGRVIADLALFIARNGLR